MSLLSQWTKLSGAHIALGANCGCVAEGVMVSLENFEQDIADYLQSEAERLNETAVCTYFTRIAFDPRGNRPVRDLLFRLEASETAPQVRQWLEPKLKRTIDSFAAMHGGKT